MAGSSEWWAPEGACSQDITSCDEQLLLLLVWQSSQASGAQQEDWGPAVLPRRHDCCSPVQQGAQRMGLQPCRAAADA